MRLSIVIPVLDEESVLGPTLAAARAGLKPGDEILVVDGGSSDRSGEIARDGGAEWVVGPRGRGRQMNEGAARAGGDLLLFLHADTLLSVGFRADLETVMADGNVVWGRFDLAFDEGGPLLRLIAQLISWRSRIVRSATGDQAIFVRRVDFEALGGYREELLFEDVDLARQLRGRGRMAIPSGRATTSARRWRRRGVWKTTFQMWTLKSLYLAGVPAEKLAKFYRDER